MNSTDSQKKSLFGRIKNSLVEEVPEKTKEPQQEVQTVGPSKIRVVPSISGGNRSSSSPVSPDSQAMAKLSKLANDHKSQDYSSFMGHFESLADVIPDELTRMKAAMRTAGCSVGDIIISLDSILRVEEEALSDFQKSYDDNCRKSESKHVETTKNIDDLIASKEALIKSTKDEIDSLNAKKTSAQEIFTSEISHLQNVRDGFGAAYAVIVGEFKTFKERISSISTKG